MSKLNFTPIDLPKPRVPDYDLNDVVADLMADAMGMSREDYLKLYPKDRG